MDKRFKNTVTMFIGTGINIFLGIITVPIITRLVDPVVYGKSSLIQTYINVIVAICLMGMDQAYVRFYYSLDTIEYKQKISRITSRTPLFFSIIIVLLIFLFGKDFFGIELVDICMVALCIFVTIFDTFTKLSVRLEQDSKTYSSLLIIHRLAYALIIIVLITVFKVQSITAILAGTAFSIVASILVALVKERKIWFKNSKDSSVTIDRNELIKYSIPFIFSSLAGWVFTAADKIALQQFSTYEQIGFYSAAANVVALIGVVQTVFSTLWVPMAVQTFEKDPNNKAFFIVSNNMMALVMFLIGATLILLKDIFAIILGGNYYEAVHVFPCLLLHPILFTLSETTVYGINFYKKTYWHSVITTVSCVVNVILNFFLVQQFGGRGAAIATGLSYIVFFVVRTVISRQYYKVDFKFGRLSIIISLFVGYAIYSTFYKTNLFSVSFYIVFLIVLLLLYRETFKNILSILKSNLKIRRM